ncbi:S8 family serine peptidase [Arenibacter palladensis]|uniref:S8 family serine peptidase n=1 Tax=Arenibacter palladensis TaxID=237373 RepID=UPI0026E3DC18|nr:S8 family serine peptidase [Arenibacter palladensis]MDO6605204.1 S8 family serine peptidase [Arenibacter palladensis]
MSKNQKSKEDLGNFSKVYGKLRMMANGSNEVNAIRAITNQTIAIRKQVIDQKDYLNLTQQMTQKVSLAPEVTFLEPEVKKRDKRVKKASLKKGDIENDPPDQVAINVFMELRGSSTWDDVLMDIFPKLPIRHINKRIKNVRKRGNIIKANIILDDLKLLAACEHIINIEGSQSVLTPPLTNFTFGTKHRPRGSTLSSNLPNIKSENAIIGIIDVGGFDYAHPDFLNEDGNTRFVAIWDQGGDFRPAPSATWNEYIEFNYGSLHTQEHMNNAISASGTIFAPIHSIEPQSQQYPSSHATHVASIAAGNSGVCSKADIAGVLISLPKEDEERTKSFTDSSRISDAVDFLLKLAKDKGKPIAINISLGTNGHAHDGSAAVNRWIDNQLTVDGRCLCVATGNAGQEKGVTPDDFGFIMGRIHTSGKIPNKGLSVDLEWHVIGNGISDVSENELEIWYQPQDRFHVMVKPPGAEWIGPIKPQQFIENQQLIDLTFLSVYNKTYHESNGNNYIGVYLSPNLNTQKIVGIKAGLWKVRLIGDEIRDGRFDAWIERDDPVRRVENFWNFPSFFSETTNVDDKSINSLACGHNVIAVGNYDTENDKINISSSQGPSRDNRQKPEIVAPGTNIFAANGFSGPDELWTRKTGTSMASPYACGAAGLLLATHSGFTSMQIAGIMKRTATPITGLNYDWKNDTGFGNLNITACIEEAIRFQDFKDITED